MTSSLLRPLVQRQIGIHNAAKCTSVRGMTILSKQSGEEYKKQNYSERMARTGRPVSPHLTIYSFPVGALSSITNRVTGVALTFGAAGVGAIELLGGSGAAAGLLQDIGSSGALVGCTAKFAVAFPCVYHYIGAIRHLAWDNRPELLENTDVEKASIALFGSSLLISAGFMFI